MLAYAPPEAMLHMILSTIGGSRAVRRSRRGGDPGASGAARGVKGWAD